MHGTWSRLKLILLRLETSTSSFNGRRLPLGPRSHWLLLFSGRQGNMGGADEAELVDKSSKPTSDQRPGPVDPVVGPVPADQSWAEWHSWVHGGPIKSPTCQDVSCHNETDCNGCNYLQIFPLGVNGGGINGVDQTKSHHNLQHKRIPHRHPRRQGKRRSGLQTCFDFPKLIRSPKG